MKLKIFVYWEFDYLDDPNSPLPSEIELPKEVLASQYENSEEFYDAVFDFLDTNYCEYYETFGICTAEGKILSYLEGTTNEEVNTYLKKIGIIK